MVILSPVTIANSVAANFPKKWKDKTQTISKNNVMSSSEHVILFSPISLFKGLERKCVLLVDMEHIDNSDQAKSLLYVAYTRAHAALWIALSTTFQKNLVDFKIKTYESRDELNGSK